MSSEIDNNKKFGLRQLYSKIINSHKHLRYLYFLVLFLILVIFFPSSNLSLTRHSSNHENHFVKTMGSTAFKASRSSSSRRVYSSISEATIQPNEISIIYGTAWKKDRTKELVVNAIKKGFRVIDTACQPKHYNEKLVGEAVQEVIGEGLVQRKELFLQTKFTSVRG